jgi:AcrR family transcriptional regulator
MAVTVGRRLSADDWTTAALAALSHGGIAAVAVEPLAARLGATKGSFYWHFRNRDALLTAALERWERTETENVIGRVEAEPDPRRRLRALFLLATGGPPGGPRGSTVEPALQAAASHPIVAPALARVTRRRLDYLDAQFRELGLPPAAARHRALLAYTAYLGHAQLAHATPELAPDDVDAYTDELIAALTAP